MIIITKNGMGIHFGTAEIAAIGRATKGVKAIKLDEDNEVLIGLPVYNNNDNVLIATVEGLGKKLKIEDIPVQGRGGKGVIVSKNIIAGATLCNNNDNIFITGNHNSICINAAEIPVLGRTSAGNIIIKDTIKSITKI